MRNSILALLRSRKFMLAVLGVINTLVGFYLELPKEVWASINALLLVVIGGIALEDSFEKANPK